MDQTIGQTTSQSIDDLKNPKDSFKSAQRSNDILG